MNLPFSAVQFLSVFEQYNTSVWPMQVVLNLLVLIVIFLTVRPSKFSSRLIAAMLALLWLWIGIVYHYIFFTSINPAAYVFAVLNVLQGLIFLEVGVRRNRLHFTLRSDLYGFIGGLFIVYALIIYPILGAFLGHVYPRSPTFGLPCPTTIFTIGLLLWGQWKTPFWVLVIPLLWSFIGFSAALTLGIREDIGLLVARICGTFLIWWRNRTLSADGLKA